MLKKLMMTTAAAALVAGSAVAQAPAPNSPKAPPMQKAEPMPAPGASAAQGSRQFVSMQSADQWLATKFKGTDVIGSNNEKIGDVTDLLIDQNGRIVAYIVGVGGFLGIGQKDVALAPVAFQVQPASDREELKLKLAMTRDELKNAPEFKAASARPAPTTGQAPPRAPATPPAR